MGVACLLSVWIKGFGFCGAHHHCRRISAAQLVRERGSWQTGRCQAACTVQLLSAHPLAVVCLAQSRSRKAWLLELADR
jgi:hypothetical protein